MEGLLQQNFFNTSKKFIFIMKQSSCFLTGRFGMKRLIHVFFLFIVLPVYSQDYNLGLPFIRYYSSLEYNGGIQNWSIDQNNVGLIYVANNYGVLEYDGASWKRYSPTYGTKVRHVAIDNDGKVYMACQGDFGYLFPGPAGSLQYTSLADSLPEQHRNFDETWRVFIDGERIVFCTFSKIFIYNKKGPIEIVEPEFQPESFFHANHRIYVNLEGKGLSWLEGNRLRPVPGGQALKDFIITGIISLSNAELWISTLHHGIFIYDGSDLRKWLDTSHPLNHSAINCAIRLKNGSFAVGAQNDGLFIVSSRGETLLHLNKSRGLSNRTVLSLFEDSQHNLWLGHNNGITYVELGIPFTYINEQVGLPGTGYTGFLDGNRLYLGTNNGLFFKKVSKGGSLDYEFVRNSEGQAYSVVKLNGRMFLGSHQGAFEIKHDEAVRLSDVQGAWTFLRLKENPDYVVEGTYRGLVLHREIGGRMVFQSRIAGFEESSRVMEQDDNGDIWMTHGYKGVYRLSLNKTFDSVSSVKYYGIESGLPSIQQINVFRIRDQLVFTTQNQVYRFDQKSSRFVVDDFYKDFFGSDPVICLAEDPYQNIYFMTLNEIGALVKQQGGGYVKNTDIFNKIKGMLNDDLQNVSALGANQVLYGAKEGFILYQAQTSDVADHPYHTLIREVRLTGDYNDILFGGYYLENDKIVYNQSQSFVQTLPFRKNSVLIGFSAPYIDGLQKTQYQYWLENSEKTWSEWTGKTEKEYTNLKEGIYVFHVRAKNIYGKISETASYAFIISPPWYRTNWTYFAGAFLIVGSLFSSFYFFDKKHKHEKRVMSIQQKKELHRKDVEIKSITKESAEEIQRLKNENLKAEIESKNKELAASTIHLINKNGFIANMKNNLTAISKRSKNPEVQSELKRIIANIDRNISQDDDWEHFSIHFDQVHGDFINRLKKAFPQLTPQDMKLSAYLRMNLTTKEMAHLLNISVRGVEISRYRLRKKLELDRSVNLQDFILKF